MHTPSDLEPTTQPKSSIPSRDQGLHWQKPSRRERGGPPPALCSVWSNPRGEQAVDLTRLDHQLRPDANHQPCRQALLRQPAGDPLPPDGHADAPQVGSIASAQKHSPIRQQTGRLFAGAPRAEMRSACLAAFASLLAAPWSKRREAFRGDNRPSPHASTLDQRRRTARSARVRHPLPDLDATAPRGWVDQTPGGASGLGFVARLIVLVLAVCCFATVPNAHGFSSFEWLTLSVLRYTRISETRFTQEIVHLDHDGTFDVVSSDEIAIARVSWPEESLANLDLVSGRFILPELAWNIYASGADISRFVRSDATYPLEGGTLYVIVCARGACDPNDLPRLRGSLQVTLQPAQALAAGAQWRRVGTTTWRNSGETENAVQLGEHVVEFREITGWLAPAPQPVTITAGQTATAPYLRLEEFPRPEALLNEAARFVDSHGARFSPERRAALEAALEQSRAYLAPLGQQSVIKLFAQELASNLRRLGHIVGLGSIAVNGALTGQIDELAVALHFAEDLNLQRLGAAVGLLRCPTSVLLCLVNLNSYIWGVELAHQLQRFGDDPPDSNFNELVQPDFSHGLSLAQTGDRELDDAVSNVFEASLRAAAYLEALNATIDRYAGAFLAGNADRAGLQLEGVLTYLNQSVQALAGFEQTLGRLRTVMEAKGIGSDPPPTAALQQLQTKVATEGLSVPTIVSLAQIGVTAAEIDAVKQRLVAFGFTQVAGSPTQALAEIQSAVGSLEQLEAPRRIERIELSAGQVRITYRGTLLWAEDVTGPYSVVVGAESPYSVSPSGNQRFFKA